MREKEDSGDHVTKKTMIKRKTSKKYKIQIRGANDRERCYVNKSPKNTVRNDRREKLIRT